MSSRRRKQQRKKPPLRRGRKSCAHSSIERLAKIIEGRNVDESRLFTEEGFRSDDSDHQYEMSSIPYVAGRESDSAEEADHWFNYARDDELKCFLSTEKGFRPDQRRGRKSCAHSAIERLAKIIEYYNHDKLKSFLSSEKGFRSEQYSYCFSLLHYVAGREFDSAEEADDWLTYACVQENQHIEEESSGYIRPLHCACKWGNIFGVEWLVIHGAKVNVKALEGRTPYYYACFSSVDTMKKMVCLEEHGYIFSPSDIVWAARNKFSSSEKANEIFHHLVNKKGLSVNAKYGRTPLHVACENGNIFGVKCLVKHHAYINSVDTWGQTPCMCACLSSMNRSAKVRYLGEKGADCQAKDHKGRTALFYVIRPSKCEDDEVKDVLRYLVIEKGIDINSVDKEEKTLLLYACDKYPSFVIIQQLIELGADVSATNKNKQNALHIVAQRHSSIDKSIIDLMIEKGCDATCQDQRGMTPLLYACDHDSPDFTVIQRLIQLGADVSATNENKQNALHIITQRHSSIDKSIIDLMIEKGCDATCQDQRGMTPLLYACDQYHPSFVVIQRLIQLVADVSATNENKQNALHIAAQNSKIDTSVIDLLIKKGCDVTCRDKSRKRPHQVAQNGERRALLRQHYDAARFSVLRREIVRQDSIKLCVIGNEMAGKTTLVNSLLRLNQPPPKDEDRTPGVQIHNCEISGVGKGSTWDFGAQPTFHSAHGLFFRQSNTIFVLVLRFRDGQQMTSEIVLLEIGRYWCAFVKAALRTLSSHLTSRLRLLIIFNLIDFEEEAEIEVSFQLKRVAQTLQKDFEDTFEILHMFEMDCSKSNSVRMNDFRERLKTIREHMLEKADGVPKLCHAIEQNLSLPHEKRREPLHNFLTSKEFEKWVVEDVGITLNEDERKVSVEYLDSSGIIVNLGPRICPRPPWLCHNVVGPLLAPPYFPFGMPSQNSAEVSLEDIESALRAFNDDLKKRGTPSSNTVTVEEAIQVLLCLDLCIEVEKSPGTFQIPALLQHSIRRDAWVEDAMFDVYRGQRYECSLPVDIISPSSFVVFQSRCSRMAKPTRREAWKDGVKLIRIVGDKVVESRIELGIKKGHCCIDIILRWSSRRACDRMANEFLVEIKDMIMQACDERSPGVILNWFYLDSKHLKQLDEDPALYTMSDVEKKVKKNAFDDVVFAVRPKEEHSSIRDLYIQEVGETGHISLLARLLSYVMSLLSYLTTNSRAEPVAAPSSPLPASTFPTDGGPVSVDLKNTGLQAEPVASPSSLSTFPTDGEPVSVNLMRACAAVRGSKWEEIGVFLISLEDLEEIRKSYGGNNTRMFKVLDVWNMAESPTVGQLLGHFDEVGVNRCHIVKKYEERAKLYSSK